MTDRFQPLKTLLRRSQLIGAEDLSTDEQWLLLDALYDFKPIVTATGAVCLAAFFAWAQGFRAEAELWTASSFVAFLGRFVLSRAYRARSSSGSLQRWIDRYFIAAVLTGFQWGLGGLILARSQDGIASSAVFGVEAALMAGAAARGYTFPAAAFTQFNLTSVMVGLASLLAGKYVLALLMLLYSVHQTVFLSSVINIKLREIASDQHRRALVLALKQSNEDLATANRRLRDIATTDALTGIGNRRSFDAELQFRVEQAAEEHRPLSLLMLDVDHFKRFNDSYGHPAGDTCLERVAAAIAAAAGDPAIHVARYGGEEFALILPDSDLPTADALAQRLKAAVRLLAVPVGEGRVAPVTVSVGIGSITPDGPGADAALIAMADQALYRAKQDGRDCIRVATPA